MARKRLGEILVEAGVLEESKLRLALNEQRRWGGPLGRVLVDLKLVSEDVMVKALSTQLNLPAVNLDTMQIPVEVLDLVPAELAEQQSVIPFNRKGSFLDVAMADPTNMGIIDELRIRTHLNIHSYLCGPKMLERALARFYMRGFGTLTYGSELQGVAAAASEESTFEVVPDPVRPRPVVPPPQGAAGPPEVSISDLGLGPAAAPARRAQPQEPVEDPRSAEQARQLLALQDRLQRLEALVARDEDVLRKLLGLLVQKGLFTREEIIEKVK